MPRYVETTDAIRVLSEYYNYRTDAENYRLALAISKVPTADAQEVKHGRWVDKYNDGDWHCSLCGAIVEKEEQMLHNWYFCYHCGAKMDEKETGDE